MLGEAAFYGTVLAVLFAPIPEHMHPEVLLESSMLVLLGLRALVAFVMFFLYMNWPILRALWIYRHIPGPIPLPFVGNTFAIAGGSLNEIYYSWYKQYGNNFKWFMGTSVIIAMNDVDMAREVGLKKFSVFTNRPPPPPIAEKFQVKSLQALGGLGIVGAKDKYWKGLRSTSASIFHSVETLASFTPLMKVTANELAERLNNVKEGEVIDIWRALGDMTLDVVGSTVFGVRFNAVKSKGNEAVKAARVIFANAGFAFLKNPYMLLAFLAPVFSPILSKLAFLFPTKAMKEMDWAGTVLTELTEKMTEEVTSQDNGKKEHEERPNAPAGEDANYQHIGENFLKLFVQTHNRETGKPLSKDAITAQAFTFVLAGYETTANTLAYCLYLLTINQEKEALLIEEIDRHKSSDLPSLDELKGYTYVDAVINEALRMHGPAPLVARHTAKDTMVKDVKIFKDTQIHLCTGNMHWDAKYFPQPDQFLPERFIKGSAIYNDQNHHALMPFGLGPRMCVASNFALTEAKLALITLYRQFRFSIAPNYEFKVKMGATVSPVNGVQVLVHHRK